MELCPGHKSGVTAARSGEGALKQNTIKEGAMIAGAQAAAAAHKHTLHMGYASKIYSHWDVCPFVSDMHTACSSVMPSQY